MNQFFIIPRHQCSIGIAASLCLYLLYVGNVSAQEASTVSSTTATSSIATTTETNATSSESETAPTRASTTQGQDRREQLMNSRQMALESFRQERIVNLSANISNRMEAVIDRQFTLITRLESRIEKLAGAGVSVSAATTELRSAASLLSETRALLTNIDGLVFSAATAPQPYTEWQAVKDRYQTVAANIRSVHSSLRTTIALLKEPTVVESVSTTTTEEISTVTE